MLCIRTSPVWVKSHMTCYLQTQFCKIKYFISHFVISGIKYPTSEASGEVILAVVFRGVTRCMFYRLQDRKGKEKAHHTESRERSRVRTHPFRSDPQSPMLPTRPHLPLTCEHMDELTK